MPRPATGSTGHLPQAERAKLRDARRQRRLDAVAKAAAPLAPPLAPPKPKPVAKPKAKPRTSTAAVNRSPLPGVSESEE